MQARIDRRWFLRTTAAAGAGIGLAGLNLPVALAKGTPNAAKLGWRLACCAYSFNKLTFFETIEKVAALGLDSIEGFVWQALSPDKPKLQTNGELPAAERKAMKKRMADAGVRLVGTYCSKLQELEPSKRIFEFAKEMGVEYLVAEPPAEAYEMLDKLCNEFKISLSVHNHPQPSPYWTPDVFLQRSKGRSSRIGVCADTGHWCRSKLEPVEQLKKLQGRLVSFHLKDVGAFGELKADCVPWGTGKGRLKEILAECKRQGFKGVFGIEYEPYKPENFDRIRECIAWFEKTAGELAQAAPAAGRERRLLPKILRKNR
jgi:sugar phosphate isomerase/epimerase